jgi:predicted amidohydrolase YtcJ
VLLTHASGHALMANAVAMQVAGINGETPDPPGGQILRSAEGLPTGLFNETAMALIHQARSAVAENEAAEGRRMIELASAECLAKGVTSFQDAGSSFEQVDQLREAASDGALGVRLWVMIRDSNERLAEKLASYKIRGEAGNFFSVGGIKVSIDGALGSRGAWLLEPYSDEPDTSGLNLVSLEETEETARLAMQHGFQLCIHAIGDRGNREILELYERAFAAQPERKDLRWRIEHAQHLQPSDIPRFAELAVTASIQGVHCTSDGSWVPQRIGAARAEEGAYVWRKLIDSGAMVINGTDVPVEDVSPIASFYASVSRRLASGETFYPEQRMSRMEALASYTKNAAWAVFEEDLKGTLETGKLADVTVLSKDILEIPEEEIPLTEVLYTIVDGKVAYRAP